jgi:hypothetical protein
MQYGLKLWGRIWKIQLALSSPDQFWECLTTGKPVNRELGPTSAPGPVRIPAGLVISLTKVVGMNEREVLSLSPAEAEARWQKFLLSLSGEPVPGQA